jgi:hypothetical protein
MVQSPELSRNQKPAWWGRLLEAGTNWLTHPRLAFHLAVLAIVLTLPSLWVGWQMDDYFHRLRMLSSSNIRYGPMTVFSAPTGDPEVTRLRMDTGFFPWWTPPNYRMAFFRYFSIFSMWLDYRLWPNWPSLMHLHSMLWYAAVVAAATFLYRRTMGLTWAAGLAALLYAVDSAHALPTAWLANRNALLATFFGILSLVAYDSWRRMGKRWCAFACPACFALALLSGEMALAAAGYLLAYALFLDRGRWSHRFLALSPCGVVLLIWAIVYRLFGFGTHGSGFYIDPLGSPAAFAKAFTARAPLLLLGQWANIPAEGANFISENTAFAFGLALIIILVFILFPLVRKDGVARFWFVGMILSFVPITATHPSNRLLFFVGLGAMGLIAQFLSGLAGIPANLPAVRVWRMPALIMAVFFTGVHLVISPLSMPLYAYVVKPFGDFFTSPIKDIPDDPQIAQQDLVLVNPPDYLFSVNLIWSLKILEGKSYPKRIRALSGGPVPLEIFRLDERSLRVRIPGGLFRGEFGRLFRSGEEPLTAGQEIHLTGMSARVTRLDKDYGPEEIVYRFSVPLEDSSLRWLQWKERTYVPFIPSPIGESVLLPAGNPRDVFRR